MIKLIVNGKNFELDVQADTPLLWVLREQLGLTGTKYGCGMALCGSCLVHVDSELVYSCVVPVSSIQDKNITTIEGLSGSDIHPVQQAWLDESVPECGYCQSGQIMAAVALLNINPQPNDQDIDQAMSPVLCRCGTYRRIRRAIHRAADAMKAMKNE